MNRALLGVALSLLFNGCGEPRSSEADTKQVAGSREAAMISASAGTSSSAPAMAAVSGPRAKAIMHQRHEGMEMIGKADKVVHDQFARSDPDLDLVRANAGKIADLAEQSSHWFPQGTGPDIGKTGAKVEIWQHPRDFLEKLGAFQHATQSFRLVSQGQDVDRMKTRFHDLGQSCNACHKTYRMDMHHEGLIPT